MAASVPEFWIAHFEGPSEAAGLAAEREAQGWDGITFADTQFVFPDPYVLMTAAASATTSLRLGISATNLVTREPSVTASAMLTLAGFAGERVTLGIGRGDSSLFYVGMPPVRNAALIEGLVRLRRLLHGQTVVIPQSAKATVTGSAPEEAALGWLTPERVVPVPIDVYATGPKTIALASRLADRVTVAVGSNAERIAEAASAAHAEGDLSRPDPARARPFGVGAMIPAAVYPDLVSAQQMIAGIAAPFVRFFAMSGRSIEGAGSQDRSELERVSASYDMGSHANSHGQQAAAMTPSLIDDYAIAGPPERCIERLLQIIDGAGLSHIVFVPPGHEVGSGRREVCIRLLAEEVLPALRAARP